MAVSTSMSDRSQRMARASMHRHSSPPTGMLQRNCACGQHAGGGECTGCRKHCGELLQRGSGHSEEAMAVSPIVHEVLCSSGHPLAAATRTVVEPRFGHDSAECPSKPAHSGKPCPLAWRKSSLRLPALDMSRFRKHPRTAVPARSVTARQTVFQTQAGTSSDRSRTIVAPGPAVESTKLGSQVT